MAGLQEVLFGNRNKRRKLKDGAVNKNQQEARRALYHCNYCQKDISHVPRIKCAECKDFDLCLECFSVGVEIKPHKNTHDYSVVENLSFPIFHPDWGADEEILLLEAIDQYGLGNWGGVSEHVGGKTPAQCRVHFMQIYIDCPTMPLPTPAPEMDQVDIQACIARARMGFSREPHRAGPSTGGAGAAAGSELRAASEPPTAANAASPSVDGGAGGEEAGGDRPADAATPAPEGDAAGGASGSGPQAVPGASPSGGKGMKRHRHDQAAAEAAAGAQGAAAAAAHHAQTGGRSMHHEPPTGGAGGTSGKAPRAEGGAAEGGGRSERADPTHSRPYNATGSYDATGFHAKRMEFDPEYDNDAECVVADMEFSEYDSPADVALKVQMLQLYNKRLDERERRRSFVLERGLLSSRSSQAVERRRNTQERDLHARMRVFARYQPQAAHEEFVEGLLLEARLRTRIAELREARRNGIRTLGDADVYETEKRRQKAAADAAAAAANAQAGQPYSTAGRGGAAAAAKAARAAAAAGGLAPPPGFTPPPLGGVLPSLGSGSGSAGPSDEAMSIALGGPAAVAAAQAQQSSQQAQAMAAAAQQAATAAAAAAAAATAQAQAAAANVAQQPPGPAQQQAAQVAAQAQAQAQQAGAHAAATAAAAQMQAHAAAAAMAAAAAAQQAASAAAAQAAAAYELSRPAASVPMGRGAGAALALWRSRRGVPLDISALPGVELLSSRERELCAGVRLLPAHYLSLKDMLLRDCEKHGATTRHEVRSFFRLEPSRALRLFDTLAAAGWVAGGPPGGGKGSLGGGGGLRALTAGGEAEGDEATGGEGMDVDDGGED
ncbi:hypothetical protein HYH03_011953 [Edaphochlamys debaryana]|uniref:Transcriptional adapter n=1 Tax=Edaphochlamys debaryana TaxID=47281 RepID=A0A835XW87_9CHLO|nr:hypothetical protein HYH03_011953 [Edaphochlamys debaryana]|eukprot:KAG2489501.1 hypothetical protein HYH03_011953 [Edaphochlamys debaryana]